MLLLGIETSGLTGSVALWQAGTCLGSRTLAAPGVRHAQRLWVEVANLLDAFQVNPRMVEAVAVSRGPGSFTGLRVGLMFAKTFAYATRCRFVAVDTFAVIAANCEDVDDVWIVEDAQRGELFAARYRRHAQDWLPEVPLAIVPGDDWLSSRPSTEAITGRGLARYDTSALAARCLDPATREPQAEQVARLGERLLLQDRPSPLADFDFWTAVPVYIRRSTAEERLAAQSSVTPAGN